jgi:hypothetical protein
MIKIGACFLLNESLITQARNSCAEKFLQSTYTHLMFIDGDIGFHPRGVLTLLALQSDDSPFDVIGGCYPKKQAAKGFADNDPRNFVVAAKQGASPAARV